MQNNDSKIINTKYIKYIIFAGIIYSVLRVVPTNQLSNFEIGTLMMVILFAIFSLESLTGVNSHTENFKETMADTKSDMFDLDMDVNLDFNKSSGNKEGHETTCKKTNNDTLDEIIKKADAKAEKLADEEAERGIDMELVEEELRKRAQEEVEEEIISDDARRKRLEEEKQLAEEEAKLDAAKQAKLDEEERKRKKELEEQLAKKLGTVDDKKVNCQVEVAKMRRDMQEQIAKLKQEIATKTATEDSSPFAKKYMAIMIADLLESKIIDKIDVENINAKLIAGTTNTAEVIQSLEKLRNIGRPKKVAETKNRQNDMKYTQLPSDYYKPLGDNIANEWSNEYTILNTDKWKVPQPRPPVCISNGPCKVCPSNTGGYPANLKDWDDSRVVSNQTINKEWALDQAKSN